MVECRGALYRHSTVTMRSKVEGHSTAYFLVSSPSVQRRSRSGGCRLPNGSPSHPARLASRVLLRETEARPIARVTARLTAASSAAREGLATRLPTSSAGQRLPKWHTHMVRIAGASTKAASSPPGFRRDRRGLSHSGNSHTTIYRWTLLSWSTLVAQRSPLCYQARGLQLSTWQSSEPWSELEHKPSPRNNAPEA